MTRPAPLQELLDTINQCRDGLNVLDLAVLAYREGEIFSLLSARFTVGYRATPMNTMAIFRPSWFVLRQTRPIWDLYPLIDNLEKGRPIQALVQKQQGDKIYFSQPPREWFTNGIVRSNETVLGPSGASLRIGTSWSPLFGKPAEFRAWQNDVNTRDEVHDLEDLVSCYGLRQPLSQPDHARQLHLEVEFPIYLTKAKTKDEKTCLYFQTPIGNPNECKVKWRTPAGLGTATLERLSDSDAVAIIDGDHVEIRVTPLCFGIALPEFRVTSEREPAAAAEIATSAVLGEQSEALPQTEVDRGNECVDDRTRVNPSLTSGENPRFDSSPWMTVEPTEFSPGQTWFESSTGVDVLLVTATPVEQKAALRRMRPISSNSRLLKAPIGQNTYFVGMIGESLVALVMSRIGPGMRDGSGPTVADAIDDCRPRAVIALGIAWGMKTARLKIGDVLVSSRIIPFDSLRREPSGDKSRAAQPEAGGVLLNRFRNETALRFRRPDGYVCQMYDGPLLSGQSLVDDLEFKTELHLRFPDAIGGEMEGEGVYGSTAKHKGEWIIAKAVCDWADGKKNDAYQSLAASSAMSLVEQVIESRANLQGLEHMGRERQARVPRTSTAESVDDDQKPTPRSSANTSSRHQVAIDVVAHALAIGEAISALLIGCGNYYRTAPGSGPLEQSVRLALDERSSVLRNRMVTWTQILNRVRVFWTDEEIKALVTLTMFITEFEHETKWFTAKVEQEHGRGGILTVEDKRPNEKGREWHELLAGTAPNKAFLAQVRSLIDGVRTWAGPHLD